jgi:RNA polymerase sigma-70 factor (ECF subfamily)
MSQPAPDPKGRAAQETSGAGTEHLASRYQQGELAAFDRLYARLGPALVAWFTMRIHPGLRGRIAPEDLTQETWWKALDAFASFDPRKGSFRAWIFRIATNTLLNAFRSCRARGDLDGGARRRSPLPPDLAEEATSVMERVSRAEETTLLLAEVGRLDDEDRSLFVHCALEGQPATRAAALIGITPAAAEKRWQRLREALGDRLRTAGILPD